MTFCSLELNIMIKLMWVNKNDQMEECFVGQDTEETQIIHPEQIRVDISRKFHQQLPANQLRTARRPENMAARTFFLESPLYLLRPSINHPCLQTVCPVQSGKIKLKIANSNNLSLQQYFLKKKFKCVYNRLQAYRNDCKSFQGRLKGIDSLIDYNWKCFKELEVQQKNVKDQQYDKIDADFESGNICRAYTSVQDQKQYYLVIQNDVNTYGYNNWFFYRLKNASKGIRRFIIVNLIKKTSFFSQGMMISIFSLCKNKYQNTPWFKGGTNITFGNINFARNHHANELYSSLSFQYDFQYQNDQVYFALNQPYTYTRLINFINQIQDLPKIQQKKAQYTVQVKNIGYSISNNIIPAVRLSKNQKPNTQVILILARQHPCQTTGSFIAEQIINYIIQQDAITEFLLNQFEFYVIPMVNPDGVIHGVSRCNMAGLDLNRQWGQDIIKELTPQTVKIKQFLTTLTKTKKIKYMIDLHGHGKKLNSFFFSCKGNQKQNIRVFSMSMKKMEPRFNLYGCTYGITKDKQNTIRSKINSMGISHSYTLETSLYGWKDENNQIKHFNQDDYKSIARNLIKSIFLIEANPKLTMERLGMTKDEVLSEMSGIIDRIGNEESLNYDNNQVLSDSDPQGDKLDVKVLLGNCENKIMKKKIQQQYERAKRPKTKRSKQPHRFEQCGRFSSKQIRESCPSGLDMKLKLSTHHQAFLGKELFIKSDMKSTGSKKISFTEKWKERRKQIEKKKNAEQKELFDAQEERNMTRLDFRSRIKTQAHQANAKKPHLPYSAYINKNQYSKNKSNNQKMKTQFREIEELSLISQQQINDTDARRSALQIKFKQLKQESLNVMLTDTLSILKIGVNEKQISSQLRQSKNGSLKIKKQHLLTEGVQSEPNSKLSTVADDYNGIDRDSVRYKKFKQFLNSGISSKKMQKMTNSVFYYFPIL